MLGYEEILKRREVWRIIEQLPEQQRGFLLLSSKYRLTAKEIADAFGRSTNSVEQEISRAKKKVRQEMGG